MDREKIIQIIPIVSGLFSGVKSGLIALTSDGRMFYTVDFVEWKESSTYPALK